MPASSPPAARGLFRVEVVANEPICREHFVLTLRTRDFPAAEPGQFVQIDCRAAAEDTSIFLRRPFSIGDLRRGNGACEIDLMGRVVGPGTLRLSRMRPGDTTDVIGPLGSPFRVDGGAMQSILVAGGVGLPPLVWLARRLREARQRVTAICAARSGDLLPLRLREKPATDGSGSTCAEPFAGWGVQTIVATDDGSVGMKGLATDALVAYLASESRATDATVYTCGPEPMMRAVAAICAERGPACQACLERTMACGMGTCQSCVVRVKDASEHGWHYELCCTQGPVFNARDVFWPVHAR